MEAATARPETQPQTRPPERTAAVLTDQRQPAPAVRTAAVSAAAFRPSCTCFFAWGSRSRTRRGCDSRGPVAVPSFALSAWVLPNSALWELGLGFRQPALQLLDAHGINRMVAEKTRCSAAALLVVELREALPKGNRLFGVVSCASHVNQPDVVGLRLLLAAVRQFNGDLRAQTVQAHEHILI